ncbi:MAG: ATP-binding cassette domain-containing protein [Desulfurococcaceae archaeon]
MALRVVAMYLLKLVGVSKVVGGELILRDLDLEIPGSATVLVRGRSGVGKSTLARIAALLWKPDSGTVLFNGVDTCTLSEAERSKVRLRHIGYVDQEYVLMPELTVLENVELPLLLLGVEKKKRRELAKDALEALGLKGLEHRYPDELSGGQKQRVVIARALVKGPRLLVADEPFSNLDNEAARNVLDYIRRLSRSIGLSALMTTVDLYGDYQVDYEYVLENGRLTAVKRLEPR